MEKINCALTKKQHEYVKSMVGPKLAQKMCAIGTRLLSAEQVEVRTDTKLMYWPFEFSNVKQVKTCWGKVDKETIFQMMRELPSVPFKSARSKSYKGKAMCRCCGEWLGSADEISESGTIRPSAVDHYKTKHCINLNLVSRTITDQDTKTMWHVVYVGTLTELGAK